MNGIEDGHEVFGAARSGQQRRRVFDVCVEEGSNVADEVFEIGDLFAVGGFKDVRLANDFKELDKGGLVVFGDAVSAYVRG